MELHPLVREGIEHLLEGLKRDRLRLHSCIESVERELADLHRDLAGCEARLTEFEQILGVRRFFGPDAAPVCEIRIQ